MQLCSLFVGLGNSVMAEHAKDDGADEDSSYCPTREGLASHCKQRHGLRLNLDAPIAN